MPEPTRSRLGELWDAPWEELPLMGFRYRMKQDERFSVLFLFRDGRASSAFVSAPNTEYYYQRDDETWRDFVSRVRGSLRRQHDKTGVLLGERHHVHLLEEG